MTIEIKTSRETIEAERLSAKITELILSNFTDKQLRKGCYQITVNITAL